MVKCCCLLDFLIHFLSDMIVFAIADETIYENLLCFCVNTFNCAVEFFASVVCFAYQS